MNRLNHIKATLLKNIEDNISYGNLEFVLLDYNSSDNLEKWCKSYLNKYISKGIVNYYRTNEPLSFNRSHSRNVALKVAKGNIICNVDADNFLGKEFAHFLNYQFSFDENIYLNSGKLDGTYGRLTLRKSDFLKVRGYDETISGYGGEDEDLYLRLGLFGLENRFYNNKSFEQYIQHSNKISFINDCDIQLVKDVYVNYISSIKSNLLYIMVDGSFKHGTVYFTQGIDKIVLENDWDSGKIITSINYINLNFNNTSQIQLIKCSNTILSTFQNNKYILIQNEFVRDKALIYLSWLQNQNIFRKKNKKNIVANGGNWGTANLQLNFGTFFEI